MLLANVPCYDFSGSVVESAPAALTRCCSGQALDNISTRLGRLFWKPCFARLSK